MSRNKFWSLMLGMLAIAALVCADVQAQGRGRGRGGPGGGRGFGPGRGVFNVMQLLQVDEVREEIELTDDQVETIKKAADEQRRGRGDRPNFRDMSDEERQAFLAEARERAEKQAKQAKEKIDEILLPHQIERLDEIALQMRGAAALTDKEIAAKVGLSEENIQAVKEATEQARESMGERMRELFAQGRDGGGREEMRKKFQELRKEMEDEVLAVLSEDQRQKFAELKGEPFELPPSAFGRGGRGRGGPGPGRRGRDGRERPQRPAEE